MSGGPRGDGGPSNPRNFLRLVADRRKSVPPNLLSLMGQVQEDLTAARERIAQALRKQADLDEESGKPVEEQVLRGLDVEGFIKDLRNFRYDQRDEMTSLAASWRDELADVGVQMDVAEAISDTILLMELEEKLS